MDLLIAMEGNTDAIILLTSEVLWSATSMSMKLVTKKNKLEMMEARVGLLKKAWTKTM